MFLLLIIVCQALLLAAPVPSSSPGKHPAALHSGHPAALHRGHLAVPDEDLAALHSIRLAAPAGHLTAQEDGNLATHDGGHQEALTPAATSGPTVVHDNENLAAHYGGHLDESPAVLHSGHQATQDDGHHEVPLQAAPVPSCSPEEDQRTRLSIWPHRWPPDGPEENPAAPPGGHHKENQAAPAAAIRLPSVAATLLSHSRLLLLPAAVQGRILPVVMAAIRPFWRPSSAPEGQVGLPTFLLQ